MANLDAVDQCVIKTSSETPPIFALTPLGQERESLARYAP